MVDAAEPSRDQAPEFGDDEPEFGQRGEPPIRETSPPPRPSNGHKRVRFAAYVPPQRRSSDGGEQRNAQVGRILSQNLCLRIAAYVPPQRRSSDSGEQRNAQVTMRELLESRSCLTNL